jgi:transcriptional regulator with XRE-family HTH domain
MVNSTHFAKRLQKILEYYNLSATAFSEELSFNRSTISHLLSGRNKPSLEFVMKVLEQFPEVELYWLLNGKGTFPTAKNGIDNSQPKTPLPIHIEKATLPNSASEEKSPSQNDNQTHRKSPLKISEVLQDENDAIERIVVFYTNGTFKEYKNR